MKVPFLDLKSEYAQLHDEILAALDRVCQESAFVLGEEVEEFEREFVAYCGVKHCVALSTGTAALHLGLLALGVQPGDEVITSPNTFLATAEAIMYCGARPVFADIDPTSANLDPRRLDRAITPRTRAILPIHLYGRPADMDAILSIAEPSQNSNSGRRGAGARNPATAGSRAGGLAEAAAFSFYPTKNLGAYGEGGALTTNDDQIAQVRPRGAVAWTNRTATNTSSWATTIACTDFRPRCCGSNCAAWTEWNARRREFAAEYRRVLSGARLEMPVDDPRDECVYHQFVVYVKNRNAVIARLTERGIETAVHYPRPLHLQPAYSSLGYPPGTFPHSEQACEHVLSLPIFPGMTAEQVSYVANSVLEIVGKK